ncbi:MAG: SDR family oxidoreductase [Planctomycetota bacterium]
MESKNLQNGLTNHVVLVSGGGTGIGKGIALALGRAGAKVAVCGRRAEPLNAVVAELKSAGSEALTVLADVTKSDDCRRAIAEVIATFGTLHILVNNAGVARFGPMANTSEDDIDVMLDTNMKGTMLLTKFAIPELAKHHATNTDASIIMIASSVADKPLKDFSVYSAAKAGIVHYTRCLALELSGQRIRVNCINPGVVETPIFATMMPSAAVPDAMVMYAGMTPLGRVGQPDDIAQAALYLSSPQAHWVTGTVLTVDGGIALS